LQKPRSVVLIWATSLFLGKETARTHFLAESIDARKLAFARNINRMRNLAALKLCE